MQLLNDEEVKRIKKEKQLAILKASNEMLEQAKETIMSTDKLSDLEKTERIRQLENAQNENVNKGRTYLNATKKEIENSEYHDASDDYKEKYDKRLKERGITDDQVHQKASATITVGKNGLPKKKRTRKRGNNEDDAMEIVRVENEDELMKKSLIKDDADFEKRIGSKTRQTEDDSKDPLKLKTMLKEQKVVENDVRSVNVSEVTDNNKKDIKTEKKIERNNNISYDFDFSAIPTYIQYDVIPLPSKGECYPVDSPLRCGRVPVAYLTASDENIIASPNMYRDGKIVDVILERKILDKRIDVNDLCRGDRDAIALWLRATGYGNDYPIVVTHPETGKQYDVIADLSTFQYIPFNLHSNDNGFFIYQTSNGDVLEFKYFTKNDEEELKNQLLKQTTNITKVNVLKYASLIEGEISNATQIEANLIEDLKGCVDDIKEIINEVEVDDDYDMKLYTSSITEQMILYTMSINNNYDKEYIRQYIENMRSREAYNYREYIINNKPGIDFTLTINVPESDGGGSFNTFLRLDNTIFINI